jgi:flagellar biosynthesis protein FlhG
MSQKDPSNKVINIANRLEKRKKAPSQQGRRRRKSTTRVIAITSGKGGVGKTNIVANLGYAFTKMQKNVLILDADLGLGNLDVLLGLAPKYNLSHVIMGEKKLCETIIEGPGSMQILPASSGIQELTHLTPEQKIQIISELDTLIDTAAGISSNVMDFNVSAHEIIVVVSPEPTSITDAYALMKVLSLKYSEKRCKVIVNMVGSFQEGQEVFRQLNLVTDKFLDINLEYLGSILFDEKVTYGVKQQKIVSELFPDSRVSQCFADLAKKISKAPPVHSPKGDTHFFWHHLNRKNFV